MDSDGATTHPSHSSGSESDAPLPMLPLFLSGLDGATIHPPARFIGFRWCHCPSFCSFHRVQMTSLSILLLVSSGSDDVTVHPPARFIGLRWRHCPSSCSFHRVQMAPLSIIQLVSSGSDFFVFIKSQVTDRTCLDSKYKLYGIRPTGPAG